jgi:hypothetical protein
LSSALPIIRANQGAFCERFHNATPVIRVAFFVETIETKEIIEIWEI